jgi:hypothetical protein
MNPLSVTEKVNFETEQGSKAKAFKLKLDKKILDDAQKRREEVAGFAAKTYAQMMLKLQKNLENSIEKDVKFLSLVDAGKILSSFCAAIGEFKFFSMVSVEDPETGETMFAFGICMSEDELIDHFYKDLERKICIKSYNEISRKINNAENAKNYENSL